MNLVIFLTFLLTVVSQIVNIHKMPRIIDHDERKISILRHALTVFEYYGLRDSSLTQIAERSGVSRPTLYQYFRDKEEIFHYAVKYFTDKMLDRYMEIAARTDLSVNDRLAAILSEMIDVMYDEHALLGALANYYFEIKATSGEVSFKRALNRRTIRFKALLRRLVVEGEKTGEFREGAGARSELIYVLAEALFVQVAVFGYREKYHFVFLIRSALLCFQDNAFGAN